MNKAIILIATIVAIIAIAGLLFMVMTNEAIELPNGDNEYRPEYIPEYDVNNDGVIDQKDLDIITANYGSYGEPGWIPADVNKDGKINYLDVSAVVSHIGAIREAPTFEAQ